MRLILRGPLTLLIAVVLLLTIGASGLYVGLQLLAAGGLAAQGDGPAAIAIPVGVALYGAAALAGGFGVLMRKRLGHRLAVVVIGVGLAELVWQTSLLGGLDPVSLFGVALWAVVLGLLLTPGVRRAVRHPPETAPP